MEADIVSHFGLSIRGEAYKISVAHWKSLEELEVMDLK